ncbi:PQQ-binding-like beta-propeller repeat protein [Streptomyces viridosporus]|uniref:outer membrane protein assembly factor BamB family protein n=1 Tax=Streptomyces viridosporus TaxID=67581 RepID=UPI003325B5E5
MNPHASRRGSVVGQAEAGQMPGGGRGEGRRVRDEGGPSAANAMTRRSFVTCSALMAGVLAGISGCSDGSKTDKKTKFFHRCPSWPAPGSPKTPVWPVSFPGFQSTLSLSGSWLIGGGSDQAIWLREARTGRLRWRKVAEKVVDLPNGGDLRHPYVTVASKGQILAGGGDGYLADEVTALCAADGKQMWRQRIPGGGVGEIYASGEFVFVGTSEKVFALSAQTGKMRWQLEVPETARLSMHGDMLICTHTGVEPFGVMGLDRETGKVRWHEKFSDASSVEVAVLDDMVHIVVARFAEELQESGARVFVTALGEVCTLLADSGRLRWRQAAMLTTGSLGKEGFLYMQTDDQLVALRSGTGEVAWVVQFSELDGNSQLEIHDEILFATRSNLSGHEPSLRALDPVTGEERWRAKDEKLSTIMPGPPGMILANPEGDKVFAIDTMGGEEIWSSPLRGPVRAVSGDAIYCHDGEEISVYDVTTGDPFYG